MINFKGHRFPATIIIMAVRWYLRYKLSLADITELLLERNINVSREAVREWVQKFGPQIRKILNKKRQNIGKRWHVDETYVRVAGVWKYVYRAVDENMEPIDIYVSENRDKKAAKNFFKKCIKVTGEDPESIRTDGHLGYDQAKKIFPNTRHHKVKCLNNKAESSHVPIKQRYRPMRGFKNINTATIFLESFESMYRFFRKTRPHNQEMRNLYKMKLDEFNALINLNSAMSFV
jgi:putative transposase